MSAPGQEEKETGANRPKKKKRVRPKIAPYARLLEPVRTRCHTGRV
jgi:hypothetical protein